MSFEVEGKSEQAFEGFELEGKISNKKSGAEKKKVSPGKKKSGTGKKKNLAGKNKSSAGTSTDFDSPIQRAAEPAGEMKLSRLGRETSAANAMDRSEFEPTPPAPPPPFRLLAIRLLAKNTPNPQSTPPTLRAGPRSLRTRSPR